MIIRDYFCKFCIKPYVVAPHLNHLDETAFQWCHLKKKKKKKKNLLPWSRFFSLRVDIFLEGPQCPWKQQEVPKVVLLCKKKGKTRDIRAPDKE